MFPAFFSSHVWVSVGLLSLAGLTIVYVVTVLCEMASDAFKELDRPAPKDGLTEEASIKLLRLWEKYYSETSPKAPQAPGLESDRQTLETLVRFDEYRRRIL